MAMTGPKVSGSDEMGPVAEINVTPLVDVMLVLLIIFMVTAPLMMSQLPIALPKTSLVPPDHPHDPIVVSLDTAGVYSISTVEGQFEPVGYEELSTRLQGLSKTDPTNLVIVQADKAVIYDRVVDLLALVGGAGFDKVTVRAAAPTS